MLIDKRSTFADNVLIPAAGTAVFGDQIDLGVAGRDLGEGRQQYLVGVANVAAVGGTSIEPRLVTDDNSALSSPTVLMSPGAVPLAQLTPARVFMLMPLPKSLIYERYLGISMITTGTFSAGRVTLFLTDTPPNWKPYAEGRN